MRSWSRRDKSLKGQGGDGDIITKHDKKRCGEKNVRNLEKHLHVHKLMTGDIGRLSGASGDPLLLSNRVSNTLKRRLRRTNAKGLGSTVRGIQFKPTQRGSIKKTRLLFRVS